MKLAFLTPGTGNYYCGVCMRDNSLARQLMTNGHQVTMLPTYLPHFLDEEPAGGEQERTRALFIISHLAGETTGARETRTRNGKSKNGQGGPPQGPQELRLAAFLPL